MTTQEKRDHPPHFTLFHFFTPIESSGFGDCNGTFRKRMRCSIVKVHPGTRVPPAKYYSEKNAFDCRQSLLSKYLRIPHVTPFMHKVVTPFMHKVTGCMATPTACRDDRF